MARTPKGKRITADDGSVTVNGKAANGEGSLYRERDGCGVRRFVFPVRAVGAGFEVARARKRCAVAR